MTPLISAAHYEFHGDKGPNGARGSTVGLSRMGLKVTKAHSHSPGINDDCWDLGNLIYKADYATGPTSWGNTWNVGHSDGNRQIGLLVGDKYRV
ncbi:hypothetical protein G7039_29180 (plasmid) [Rhizobium leguminosarum]|nr:hypothetical protein G7039_29180 [Rhizobium leguminosarum]